MITGQTTHLTVAEATKALTIARAGEIVAYAYGELSADSEGPCELRALREFIWDAYARGHVTLVQRRIDAKRFEYQARKRSFYIKG
jgi:hypothetical protein